MKLYTFGALATALTLSFAPFSVAQAQERANPWQSCGIGAVIFPDNGTAAAISNIIWDLGTTAVSSNLSSPESCEGSGVKAAMLIQSSYAAFEAETAVGEGQYMAALADVMNCSAEARAPLYTEVRANMAVEMAKPEYAEMDKSRKAETYYMVVDKAVSTTVAGKCSLA